MPKGDKINTIKNILSVSEELFSEKGFDGTSINMIAETANVNKALIYYHFKDKDDIVNSLLERIIKDCDEYIEKSASKEQNAIEKADILYLIREELSFMKRKEKILSVMLMEALKGDSRYNYFFQFAEKVIQNESDGSMHKDKKEQSYPEELKRFLAHEFFTGFIPIIAFVVFRDKWCEYFQCEAHQLEEYFLDSFNKTHLSSLEQSKEKG